MFKVFCILSLVLLSGPSYAAKACDELKSEIEVKIKSHGVASFTLAIVSNDEVKDQKVVGSCDGGTKKIVYTRG